MGTAVASAAIAGRYSRDRKISQSESDSEEYFHRGKECHSLEMVSIYHIVLSYTMVFAHIGPII
jgi:hypothetical protein